MVSKKTVSQIVSACISPLLLISIFITLNNNSPIHYYLIWLLIPFIIFNWMSWDIWGGIITIVITIMVTLYAWMFTGHGTYLIELIPAFILPPILYGCEERIKKSITIKGLEIDEKERNYNLLLQEHKKREALREAYYKKTKRFSRLSQIVKELGFLLSPEEINRAIISNLVDTIENGDVYLLYRVTSDLQNLQLQVLESPSGAQPQDTSTLDEFNIWVMRHRQPLIVTDVSKDYRFNTTDILTKTHTRSLIISPLMTGDRLLGIIRIDSYTPETLSIDDLRLLTIITHIGALTIYNAQLYKQTEYLAIRDDLTGLYVKRYFHESLEKLITEAQIQKEAFSLLLLDLDRFKDFNDQFGHSIGDRILKSVARLLEEGSPPSSIVARYGGEEFAIILPRIAKTDAMDIAEKIRGLVEEQPFSVRREGFRTTISIGVAEFPCEDNTSSALIETADKRLYEAKRKGRNRVAG